MRRRIKVGDFYVFGEYFFHSIGEQQASDIPKGNIGCIFLYHIKEGRGK